MVAVKSLRPGASQDDRRKEFLAEARVMAGLRRHPNLVQLVGVCTVGEPLLMVLEYLAGGSLEDFLLAHGAALNDPKRVYVAHCVALGLAELAERKVIHRDLAARNILIGPNFIIKIADFGLSRESGLTEEVYYRMTSAGTAIPLRWIAPEVAVTRRFTLASDIYAFGIVLYELWSDATLPFAHLDDTALVSELVVGQNPIPAVLPLPRQPPEPVARLYAACLSRVPEQRPSASGAAQALIEIGKHEAHRKSVKLGKVVAESAL